MGSEPGNGWNWSIGIAKRGYNVHVITISKGQKNIEKALANMANSNLNIQFHYIDHSRFWAKAYYWNFTTMYIAYWLWQKKIFTFSKKKFKKGEIDFIHHVTWGSLKIGSKLNQLKVPMLFGPVGGGQKTPLQFKTYLGKDYLSEKLRNVLGEFILRNNPLSKGVLKNCQMLVTNTDTLDVVSKYCKKTPKLIFDAAIKTTNIPAITVRDQNQLNLIWVGRINGFKGLSLIITALSLINKEHLKSIHLEIVGDGPDRKHIEYLIQKFHLQKNISLTGMIPYEEVQKHYEKNNTFIYTSLRDSFPSQILEAQLWSLPVITLNLHGQSLMVDESIGIKCSVDEPNKTLQEISEGILFMLQQPIKRQEMGENAQKKAMQQTWDKKIDTVVDEFYPMNL